MTAFLQATSHSGRVAPLWEQAEVENVSREREKVLMVSTHFGLTKQSFYSVVIETRIYYDI